MYSVAKAPITYSPLYSRELINPFSPTLCSPSLDHKEDSSTKNYNLHEIQPSTLYNLIQELLLKSPWSVYLLLAPLLNDYNTIKKISLPGLMYSRREKLTLSTGVELSP